jgi:hypothetical protein
MSDVKHFFEHYENEKQKQKLDESLIDPNLIVAIASLGAAVFTFLNAKTVTDLILKYGKKVVGALSELEKSRNTAKANKSKTNDEKEHVRSLLAKSGMAKDEIEMVIGATFE